MRLAITSKIIIVILNAHEKFQGEHAALLVEEKLNSKNITINGSLLRFHVEKVEEL